MRETRISNVLTVFKTLVETNGDSIAIETEEKQISFKELDKLSDVLMDRILEATAGEKKRIILFLNHTYTIVVAVLAVLKSGNVYVPVSISENEERKRYISNCCNATIAISEQEYPGIDTTIQVSDITTEMWYGKNRKYAQYDLCDEVYILFTSGSTGEPKGCAINYGNLLYILNNMQNICPTDDNSAYCFSTPYTFDVSTTEVFGWIGGGKVIVCDITQYAQYRDFCIFVANHKVTHIAISPSGFSNMLKVFSEEELSIFAAQIKFLMVAGEEFHKSIYEKWNYEKWSFRLFNLYGPTEATVYALAYELKHDMNYDNGIPLGEPLDGCSYTIDGPDDNGVGELVLSGSGICSGYINNEAETLNRFSVVDECRSYRTGDLVSFKNGQLLYHGRNDDQIQINGIRVELGEVESEIMKVTDIEDVCVVSTGKVLACYVCLKIESEMDIAGLKELLYKSMPRYKVPNYIKIVDQIPLNEHRKADRKKIISDYLEMHSKKESEREKEPTRDELVILNHMKHVLENEGLMAQLSVNDSFFEYGGDSLSAFTLLAQLEEEFGISMDVDKIYLHNTARTLSEYISGQRKIHNAESPDESDNLSHISELTSEVIDYLYSKNSKHIRTYDTIYLQRSYYYDGIGGVISFDYNLGDSYTEDDIYLAIKQLISDNSVLRSKITVNNNNMRFIECELEDSVRIPSVKITCKSVAQYLSFLKDNYAQEVFNARYHEGFLSLFVIANINQSFYIIACLDHCIADAGCESIIKKKLSGYLNHQPLAKTMDYHTYCGLVIRNNPIGDVCNHHYIEALKKYVIPERETLLTEMDNKTYKIEISDVKCKNTTDYNLFISYVVSKMLSRKVKRDIATGIILSNRDYKMYDATETIGDLHVNMLFTYNQGMSFDEYRDKAREVINMVGEKYFQPFQSIKGNYPSLSSEQEKCLDMIIQTGLLKVNFLGKLSLCDIHIVEKSMFKIQQNLHTMQDAIYVTAYASMDKLLLYFSKDFSGAMPQTTYSFDELVRI